MTFAPNFKQTVPFRPLFNVGGLMDIQTGKYFRGQKGEWILNGGVASIEGATGIGNSYKSTILAKRQLTVLHRYIKSIGFVYDTENSATIQRFQDLSRTIDPTGKLAEYIDPTNRNFQLTSAEIYDGTEWYNVLREFATARIKGDKRHPTPFVDLATGDPILWYYPVIGFVDSLSMFRSANVQKKIESGGVGNADQNTVYMNNAQAKAQLVDDLPYLTGKSGISIMMSAHMGDIIVMDQYNGPSKKLADVKANRKMKKVPESFTFLTHNLFEIIGTRPLLNKTDGCSEFPLNEADAMKGNTDLMVAIVKPIRTKYGATGIPFELVVSQSRGVEDELSEFWYIKNHDRYGIGGNLIHMTLDLYPDVKFKRQNIRDLTRTDPKFNRALQITSDLCQMRNLWAEYAHSDLNFTVTELYEKIKSLGYDWDKLLETRPYWTFDQYTHEVPFLSTKDLVEMYHERYTPFWMDKK